MQENKPLGHMVAGVILAAVLIVYSIILQFTGLGQNQTFGWLSYLILIIGLIVLINMYAKSRNNQVSFGGLFSYGFKATAIATLIMVVFLIIFFLAFPEFKEKIMQATREGMEAGGKMSDDQIEQAVSMFSKNFMLFTIGGTLFMYLIIGAIGSLIGAAVTNKKPVNPLDQFPS